MKHKIEYNKFGKTDSMKPKKGVLRYSFFY